MIDILPSVLAADFSKMGEELAAVERAGVRAVHLDVMDGQFVPATTFDAWNIAEWRGLSTLFFDVHLMIANAEMAGILEAYAEAGADAITVHVEALDDAIGTLQRISELGKKAGLSLKPETAAAELQPYLEYIDQVLVMTVEPGAGGQAFMENQLAKIAEIRAMIDASGHDIKLLVDGGINSQTIAAAAKAGADSFVAGTAVFGAQDYEVAVAQLQAAAEVTS